jgi:hypothetical protein
MVEVEYVGELLSKKTAVGAAALTFVLLDEFSHLLLIPAYVSDVLGSIFRVPYLFHVFGMVFPCLLWILAWHRQMPASKSRLGYELLDFE